MRCNRSKKTRVANYIIVFVQIDLSAIETMKVLICCVAKNAIIIMVICSFVCLFFHIGLCQFSYVNSVRCIGILCGKCNGRKQYSKWWSAIVSWLKWRNQQHTQLPCVSRSQSNRNRTRECARIHDSSRIFAIPCATGERSLWNGDWKFTISNTSDPSDGVHAKSMQSQRSTTSDVIRQCFTSTK